MTSYGATPCPRPPTTGTATAVPVTTLVMAGLDRATALIHQVGNQRPTHPPAHAARARRLQVLHDRRARWWGVLIRVLLTEPTAPTVYRVAAIAARCAATEQARFWRDAAADWTARAEQRPTSDAAGAMSNWHDLGVTELGRPHLGEAIGAQP